MRWRSQSARLTGVEFELLWTLFTFGYILSAPFVGFFTDRYRRTLILAICILILSGATILCGLAQTKMVLYLSRFLIGLGEAGCLIIGPTLISDFFFSGNIGEEFSLYFLSGAPSRRDRGLHTRGPLRKNSVLGERPLFMRAFPESSWPFLSDF